MSKNHHPEEELEPAEVLNLYGLSRSADDLIAKIKAEALREAAKAWQEEDPALRPTPDRFMVRRAKRNEGAINE